MKYALAVALLFSFFPDSNKPSDSYLIRVNFDKAELHVYDEHNKEIGAFPVALPKVTPPLPQTGLVHAILHNPYWFPTKATRKAYYKKTGEELPASIKPGDPRNAMGKVKICITWKGRGADQAVRIHGTNLRNSIGKRVSRGCIRMRNEDVMRLAQLIKNKKTSVVFL